MNIFKDLPIKKIKNKNKENTIKRSYAIDSVLYNMLQDITNNEYEITINELVNLCIENLINEENIIEYETTLKNNNFNRSYRITETNLKRLEELKSQHGISLQKLMNIAIYNTLKEAGYNVD